MDVRVGLWGKLSAKELMLLNCGIGEDSWESLALQPDHPKDQSWVFIGRTDAEAETPILWPSHVKSWLIGKDPDVGRDWEQEEKGMTEDEMAGWHHWLNGHEFEQALGVGDGQGGLVCCSPWGCKESDTTERLLLTFTYIQYLATSNKGPSSQGYGFSSGHVWMWQLDYEESWALKSWCFWSVISEKTLESPLDCKEIQPVYPKGNQSWIAIGRTDAEAETPTFWLPDMKNWLIWKDPYAGKDWRQEEKGMTG